MVEPTIPATSGWLWPLCFAASMVLLGTSAVSSARTSQDHGRRFLRWVLAVGLVLGAVLAADGLNLFAPALSKPVLVLFRSLVVLAGVALACWIALPTVISRQDRALRLSVWLLVMGTWLLALSSGKLSDAASLSHATETQLTLGTVSPDELVPAKHVKFETDRGRHIVAYCAAESVQQSLAAWSRTRPDRKLGLTDGAIEKAPPDPRSNCYGWVFTCGEYVIASDDAEKILSDNGYQRVDEPQPGDVVVFRSTASHQLAHAGIVKVVDADLVLVESKWGFGGRFLHQPQNQPFCKEFDYYRSRRPGHQLRARRRA